jgi:dolichol-phosphate mannosyltransferase
LVDVPTKTCVVVPTYNEAPNIELLVKEVGRHRTEGLVLLFVDDSSPDGSGELVRIASLREPWVGLMVRKGKLGLGSAYRDGFREAIRVYSPEVIVEMDADLQHPPSSIPDLLEAIKGGADVAVGSRYVVGGSIKGWGLRRRVVSGVANAFARRALGLPVKDATSGFRAYRMAAAKKVSEADLPARGFEFQVATLQLLKTEMKIVEVPYAFSPRSAGKSKLGPADMAAFLFSVVRLSLGRKPA